METPPPLPVAFKDRKAGLIVFGVLTLLAGCLSALFVPLMIFAHSMAPAQGAEFNSRTIIPGVIVYAVGAVILIWLGIGSIRARRWARALLLVASWSTLLIGIPCLGMTIITARHLPEMMRSAPQSPQTPMPPGMDTFVIVVMLVMCSLFYVLLPLVWVLFYGSRNVKATCEVRDPVVRWTDKCPLPVLAVSLWLAFGMVTMLTVPIAFHGLFAFFGVFLTGIAGSIANVVMAAIWCYCAWAFYKLRMAGWWVLVVTLLFFGISAVVTYSRHDITEVYRQIGYPEQQIALIKQLSIVTNSLIMWGTLGWFVVTLCYLVYVRRFFPSATTSALAP